MPAACPAPDQSRPCCGSPPASATTTSPSGSARSSAAWTGATSPCSPPRSPPPTAANNRNGEPMIQTLQSHYGFTVMPFTAAIPVPGLFGSAAHKEAVARLRWLISARGLGVLTGEVGSGKTVAVRAAADGLDPSRHTLVYLPNPQIGVRGLHGAVATALGQAPRFHHATLIPQVEAALAAEAEEKNRHVLVAIDEAHLLSHDQLEALRLLTNSVICYLRPVPTVLIT